MSDALPGALPSREPPEIERGRQVFRFLKAFAERNEPIRRVLSEELWTLRLCELPEHPAIALGEVQLGTGDGPSSMEELQDDTPLLRVRRPKLTAAPPPPSILLDFLQPGWKRCDGEIEVLPTRNVLRDGETVTESFVADPARVAALEEWRTRWGAWAEAERPAMRAMRVFERLYELRGRIEREGEEVELILGDGRLRWRQPEGVVDHPILLQRVELEFDPSGEPEFRVLDADRPPELYSALLVGGEALPPEQLNRLRQELQQGGYHPLAGEATSAYLRRLVQLLGPRGAFREHLGSDAPKPDPIIVRDPVLFLRKRTTGFAAAFDRVLQDLENHKSLPVALTRLVGVEPPAPSESVEYRESPWGEPPDILLSKPANAEQIQVARALERHRAILVQGPPGTGKSHTIANLVGHLVAQGKRVLITSHTTKALRVLRGQMVKALQPLCVAVLDNDLDGRRQMEEAVRGILVRLSTASEEALARDVDRLTRERAELNAEIDGITAELRAAREAEYRPINVGGEAVDPADGARWIRDHRIGNDWIPVPVVSGAPLPLSEAELQDLYATNSGLTPEEEGEICDGLPDTQLLPEPDAFRELVDSARAAEPEELSLFWDRPVSEAAIPALEDLERRVEVAVSDLAYFEAWQRAVVAAGYAGKSESQLWVELARLVASAADAWESSRSLLLEHEVEVPASLANQKTRQRAVEIATHISDGGTLGGLTLFLKRDWKSLVKECRVNGRSPTAASHFRAIATYLGIEESRKRLAVRWARQAVPAGLPDFSAVGSPPEPVLCEYTKQFEGLLEWWGKRWNEIQAAASSAGFRWERFRASEVARSEPAPPFERDVAILSGPMRKVVATRAAIARRARADRILGEVAQHLSGRSGRVWVDLHSAVQARDPEGYELSWRRLHHLLDKEPLWRRRQVLLGKLRKSAPGWARAMERREASHGADSVPGDATLAWRWRQLHQEITRRAELDETVLARKLEQRRSALRDVTARLIEARAWLGQLRRTDLQARQALQGWADTQRRIGRGTGKRAPALQAEARRLLAKARNAVPVWIMPLSRVAESFDTSGERFDVVIVDEASQADITGLLAWYLGDRIAVVGDHEQVSPLAVGQSVAVMQQLIFQHLTGIPNNHLYDGTLSVYDLARQCFGGSIALREHFRCVPDIIEFSNELCYNLEIRPLRDGSKVQRPHVIEHVVQPVLGAARHRKTNMMEARWIAALLRAACEMEQYAGQTMGAITLLGDEQAELIQQLALQLIGAVRLDQRRFIAGNSAQFQGDERDVVFLSMVDAPTGAPLPLRQQPAFKQRYNVAASRARNQLWLVHSLDPNSDLKAGDLRRQLIEYVRNPGARRRAAERAAQRAESPFETAVIERLITAGYRVEPQIWVGRYRIDMVVSDGRNQVALECDGDRYHGFEQIPADMARQAILERVGWRFIRVRGTKFYREPDATMQWVFQELDRLGVEPVGTLSNDARRDVDAEELRNSVVRRAWEIMRDEGWVPDGTVDEE